MKNFLMLNNRKIELTPEQVKQIENSFDFNKVLLKDIEVGETFKVGTLEFIVLEHVMTDDNKNVTYVLLKDFWKTTKFDSSFNNYKESEIRKDLNNNFYNELSGIVGTDNIVEHTVYLAADDGRTDYGHCEDNISLLTCEMYRKYVYVLEKYNPKKWWWLATAYSTKSNGYETSVRCVDSSGTLSSINRGSSGGVRPFCILKSNIFVSK
ncbi:MAG: hypothetical protein IKY45_04085 [Clostridia bacterium]|nr:hypothetical protein [Clostridia bacterium]